MGDQALISELNHFDLFLTGGTILTGNPGRPEIRDGSIGVRDGKITWLGHGTPQSGHTTKRVLKLAGCVVTPGFVNTHTHSILTMVRGVAVDAGFAPSYTPGIPKGPELNPDQARAFARRNRRPDDHVGRRHDRVSVGVDEARRHHATGQFQHPFGCMAALRCSMS